MKQVLSLLLTFVLPVFLVAQKADSSILLSTDSNTTKIKDSSLAQNNFTYPILDTIAHPKKENNYDSLANGYLKKHFFLNSTGNPVAMTNKLKKNQSKNLLFYFLLSIVALLAFFRFFYTRYFNTLFRVFFNTTLRQSQLTDQLLQAKLASLLFNMLFSVAGGMYAYFLLVHFNWIDKQLNWFFIFSCIAGMATIYLLKYITLKFTGWLTGNSEVLDTYIFIVFLINKIIGILLIPVIVILAFSDWLVKDIAVIISLLFIGLLFLLRFFRSYGLLQNQIKVSRFHFLLYILGIEILPLLLIYKSLVVLLSKTSNFAVQF